MQLREGIGTRSQRIARSQGFTWWKRRGPRIECGSRQLSLMCWISRSGPVHP